jgi:transposase InsO family protein
MFWRSTTMSIEKQKFLQLYELKAMTFTELCSRFGVSRTTGYNLVNNFKKYGQEAITGRSRAHKSHPLTTPQDIIQKALEHRGKHPTWGAKKIRVLLTDEFPEERVPSVTTVNDILKRNGLIAERKRRLTRIINIDPYFDPQKPNEIWSADFKGQFKTQDRKNCYPLTVADSHTRFLFAAHALESPTAELVIPVFDRLFREFGLPEMLHTDNGAPFGAANSLRRLTRFSAWLMDRGITPVYSDPGKPQQNGRHERMHRDLKAEATRPAARDLQTQQLMLDRFIDDYNNLRPHEALGMKRPREVHQKSERLYNGTIYGWDYDKKMEVRMVGANGTIRWKSDKQFMISTALCGKFVALKEVADGIHELYYRHVLLGFYNERTEKTYEVEAFHF